MTRKGGTFWLGFIHSHMQQTLNSQGILVILDTDVKKGFFGGGGI